MRIGEIAGEAGVPAKTIRYYEQVGLLPQPARSASGYRDYDREVLSRLRFIRAAQSIGLSLGEIREILAFRERGETPCQHVASLIERHAADLQERIKSLEAMHRELVRLAAKSRRTKSGDTRQATFCHIIETITPAAGRDAGRHASGADRLHSR